LSNLKFVALTVLELLLTGPVHIDTQTHSIIIIASKNYSAQHARKKQITNSAVENTN